MEQTVVQDLMHLLESAEQGNPSRFLATTGELPKLMVRVEMAE
jgi:hypothetical protein